MSNLTTIEKFERHIEDINRDIEKLILERKFIENLVKKEKLSMQKEVSSFRKNSKNKIETQLKIVDYFSKEKNDVKVKTLYNKCAKDTKISESCFRNYLSDLEKKEILFKGKKKGYWRMNPSKNREYIER